MIHVTFEGKGKGDLGRRNKLALESCAGGFLFFYNDMEPFVYFWAIERGW